MRPNIGLIDFLNLQMYNISMIEIDDLLDQRQQARDDGDYELSDKLREDLKALGVKVVDTKEGQVANGGTEYSQRDQGNTIHMLMVRIGSLERHVRILEQREHEYNFKLAKVIKENLKLKHG